MNVVMISRVRMNPYVHLLAQALQEVEPGLTCTIEASLTLADVARWRGTADVIHIHWPELIYRSPSIWRGGRKLAELLAALLQARRAGIKLIYTAHNIQRQEDDGSLLDAIAVSAILRLADAAHVHDEEAQRQLLLQQPSRRVAVIAHGNYIGAYPDACTRETARQRLGIAGDAFAYLALGQIRRYKGLDDLITAFCQLAGDHLVLLIAGNPHRADLAEQLRRLAAADQRIRLDLRFVPEDELQYYMHAADVAVLPYRSATTSGAAILALSFGVPVIAPDVWPFRGLIRQDSGVRYADDADGLLKALMAAQSLDQAHARQAALSIAQSLDWRPIARQHVEVYKRVKGGG
jgi:glycosyltransferase involved in cell wall biosynthesis